MDNFIDILILVLVLGGTIVSSLVKNAKKKNEQAPAMPADIPEGWGNEDQYVVTEQPEDVFTSVNTQEDPWSFDKEAVRQSELAASQQPIVRKKYQPSEDMQLVIMDTDEQTESKHILDHFSLYDAVIYSEILKPKFEE